MAVYFLIYTKVYGVSGADKNISLGEDQMSVIGNFQSDEASVKVAIEQLQQKKLLVDDQVVKSMKQYLGRHQAVIVTPDDIRIINGSSEYRRNFLNGLLAKLDSGYLQALLRYRSLLRHRNAYLKEQRATVLDQEYMDALDSQLAPLMVEIRDKRQQIFIELSDLVNENYRSISGKKDDIVITYQSYEGSPSSLLHSMRRRDHRAGRTLEGSHRDDLVLGLNSMKAKESASQGQKKSLLFSLKLAESQILHRHLGEKPILLLDDLFEKLDDDRIRNLLELLGDAQVFVSDTSLDRVQKFWEEGVQIVTMT